MTSTILPLTELPIVRKAAMELANDLTSVNRDVWPYVVDELAGLLCDLSRESSRLWWTARLHAVGVLTRSDILTHWDNEDRLRAAILATWGPK